MLEVDQDSHHLLAGDEGGDGAGLVTLNLRFGDALGEKSCADLTR